MLFLLELVLPFAVCAVMSGAAAFLWWKTLSSPSTFVVVAFLATFGLHRVLQAITEFLKLFMGNGDFLEFRPTPDLGQLARESVNTEMLFLCALLVALGMPLLYWLRSAMVRV